MFEKILICLDGSRLAEQTLFDLVEPCFNLKSELVLFQAVTSGITIPPPQSIHLPNLTKKVDRRAVPVSDLGANSITLESKVGPQLEEISREQTESLVYLERLAQPLRERGIKVHTVSWLGEAGESVLKYAAKNKISLIALSAHGLGGVKSRAPGRVAQYILREAELPVLLIKPS